MDDEKNSHYVEFHNSFPDLKVGDKFPGAAYISTKIDVVRKYMMETFQIDIDRLRSTIIRRQNEVMSGQVDLTALDVD